MAKINFNGSGYFKVNGPLDATSVRADGSFFASIEEAHNAWPYRGVGRQRRVLNPATGKIEVYEYTGITEAENTQIEFLKFSGYLGESAPTVEFEGDRYFSHIEGSDGEKIWQDIKFVNPVSGKELSVAERLSKVNFTNLEEYRLPGDLDADVIERAIIGTMNTSTLVFNGKNGDGIYKIHRQIIVPQGTFNWQGGRIYPLNDAEFLAYKPSATATEIEHLKRIRRIDVATTPTDNDLMYPTPDNSGPLKGAFYFPTTSYNSTISGMAIADFRFCLAFKYTYNGMAMYDCDLSTSNVGVIHHVCCQGFKMVNTKAGGIGCVAICMGAAVPAGSIDAGYDTHYIDAFKIINTRVVDISTQYQPHFDNWYRQAIFKPDVVSYGAGNTPWVWQYPNNHRYSNPTGWVFWMPAPIKRPSNSMEFTEMYCLNGCQRGFALLGQSLNGFRIGGNFSSENCHPEVALFEMQQVYSAKIEATPSLDGNLLNYYGAGPYWTRSTMLGGVVTGNQWLDQQLLINKSKINVTGVILQQDGDKFKFEIQDSRIDFTFKEVAEKLRYAKLYVANYDTTVFNELIDLSDANVNARYVQSSSNQVFIYFKATLPKNYSNAVAAIVFDDGFNSPFRRELVPDGNGVAKQWIEQGNTGFGTSNPQTKVHVAGDITIEQGGIIKIAPNGTKYRYTIDNAGNEVKTQL